MAPETPDLTADELPPLADYHRLAEKHERGWGLMARQVLDLLWKSRVPLGAYDIAKKLESESSPRKHANSVYRALRTLETAGLVIPIISWSRFAICPDPTVETWGIMLCSRCPAHHPLIQPLIVEAAPDGLSPTFVASWVFVSARWIWPDTSGDIASRALEAAGMDQQKPSSFSSA